MNHLFLALAAINGFLFVALGAFGAHGLKNRVPENLMGTWETAAHYQGIHSLALLAVGILLLHWPASMALRWAGGLFSVGIVLFSGSLYVLVLTETRWLGAITPFGGTAFLAAWVLLLVAVIRAQ